MAVQQDKVARDLLAQAVLGQGMDAQEGPAQQQQQQDQVWQQQQQQQQQPAPALGHLSSPHGSPKRPQPGLPQGGSKKPRGTPERPGPQMYWVDSSGRAAYGGHHGADAGQLMGSPAAPYSTNTFRPSQSPLASGSQPPPPPRQQGAHVFYVQQQQQQQQPGATGFEGAGAPSWPSQRQPPAQLEGSTGRVGAFNLPYPAEVPAAAAAALAAGGGTGVYRASGPGVAQFQPASLPSPWQQQQQGAHGQPLPAGAAAAAGGQALDTALGSPGFTAPGADAAGAAAAVSSLSLGAAQSQHMVVVAANSPAGQAGAAAAAAVFGQPPPDVKEQLSAWLQEAGPRAAVLQPTDVPDKGLRIQGESLLEAQQPIHLFCLTGALNLSNTLAGRHQQCTQLAVRTGQRLGSGGFGCVAAAVLDPSSRHVVGLPGKFVLKVARFGEVLPSHKLHILPKSVFVSTAEHSLSLAADEAHVLQVYGAFLAVARVGEQEAAAVAAVQRPADPGAGRTLTPHSAAIIIDSSSCGGGGVGAAGGTEAAATEAGGVVAVFAALLCEPMAGDLHTWLQQHPQGASPTEAALGTYMLLRGIHRLHSRGAKHKDVKPGNLLLDWASWFDPEDGAAWQGARLLQLALKLGDMGLATRHGLAGVDKVYAGTPGWWAPEVAEGHGTDTLLTGAVDIWAIGLVFAACRLGPSAVADLKTLAVAADQVAAHLVQQGSTPGKLWGGVLSEAEAEFLQATLKADPKERPLSGAVLQLPLMKTISRVYSNLYLESGGMRQRELDKHGALVQQLQGDWVRVQQQRWLKGQQQRPSSCQCWMCRSS